MKSLKDILAKFNICAKIKNINFDFLKFQNLKQNLDPRNINFQNIKQNLDPRNIKFQNIKQNLDPRTIKNRLKYCRCRKNKISNKENRNSSENPEHDERIYIINQIKSLQRQPKWYDPLLDCLIDFGEVTGLHGAAHVVNTKLPKADRIAWFCIILIAMGVSSILLYISWNWGDETPTKQNIDSLHAPVYLIPFPAVTICNINHISKEKATKLSNEFKWTNYTSLDFLKVFKLALGGKGGLNETDQQYITFDRILKSNNYTLAKFLYTVQSKCSDLITKCMWKGEIRKCEALFQEIQTSSGKCCSFNYFASNKTTYSTRVKLRNENFKVPQRVTSCGSKTALNILIEPKTADYFATQFSHQGLKVFLHDSYDFADENSVVTFIQVRSESHIQVTGTQTFATEDVLNIKPSVRNCYFFNENQLRYMQRYSLVNCYSECRSHHILKLCGCIPDTLPRNDSVKLCEISDIPCILKNRERYILSALPGLNLPNKTNETMANIKDNPCDCLPDCQVNRYRVISYGNFLDRNFSYSFKPFFNELELTDQILLHVYFSDILITRYKTTAFQTWLEILASFGGLLGFVIGFSMVTVQEFLFSIFLRPILNHFGV